MEIHSEFRVGDTATAKPGPVQPLLLVTRLLLRHTMAVSPALTSSFGWDLWRAIAAACTARVIGSLEVSVRVRGQQLTIYGIVTPQAVGHTQTGSKDTLMCRETRPIAITVFSRHNTRPLPLRTPSHPRCGTLHPSPTAGVRMTVLLFLFPILPWTL